jgi:hypothetical protein
MRNESGSRKSRFRPHEGWLPLIALLVAIAGGVPGIVAVIAWVSERPHVTGEIRLVWIQGCGDREQRSCVLIYTKLLNSGSKPSTVVKFRPQFLAAGSSNWVDLPIQQAPIEWPVDAGRYAGWVVRVGERDLLTTAPSKPLAFGDALYGWLFCPVKIPFQDLSNKGARFRIMCFDVFGTKFLTNEVASTGRLDTIFPTEPGLLPPWQP